MRIVLLDSEPERRDRLRSSLEQVAAGDGEADLELDAPVHLEDGLVLLRVSETPTAVLLVPEPTDWLGSLRSVLSAAGAAPVLVLSTELSGPLRLEARRLGATDWIDVSQTAPREVWRRIRGADAMASSLPALQRRLLHEVSRALARVETALTGWEDKSSPPRAPGRGRRSPYARLLALVDGRALHLLLYLAVSIVGLIGAALGLDLMPRRDAPEALPEEEALDAPVEEVNDDP